jgi:hypothetical protein
MNTPGGLSGLSGIPGAVDIKDPRIRYTFADVAMKFANDGPMYATILLVGILAASKNIEGIHAIFGCAFALQARSKPPDNDKLDRMMKGAIGILILVVATTISLGACR